jgi:hypothetical protein
MRPGPPRAGWAAAAAADPLAGGAVAGLLDHREGALAQGLADLVVLVHAPRLVRAPLPPPLLQPSVARPAGRGGAGDRGRCGGRWGSRRGRRMGGGGGRQRQRAVGDFRSDGGEAPVEGRRRENGRGRGDEVHGVEFVFGVKGTDRGRIKKATMKWGFEAMTQSKAFDNVTKSGQLKMCYTVLSTLAILLRLRWIFTYSAQKKEEKKVVFEKKCLSTYLRILHKIKL